MFQRQGGLHHAGDSGGSLGVSQLRFDAAQRTPSSVGIGFSEHRGKGLIVTRGLGLLELHRSGMSLEDVYLRAIANEAEDAR